MKYKTIKKLVPFCHTCQKEIRGNGSIITPYICKCGFWEFDEEKNDYILKRIKIYDEIGNWDFKKLTTKK